MSAVDDELDLDDVFPDEAPPQDLPPEPTEGEGDGTDGEHQQDDKLNALQAQLSELKAKGDVGQQITPLLELGRQFLERQGKPAEAPVNRESSNEEIAEFGKKLQEAIVIGKPEEAFRALVQIVDQVSTSRVNEALRQHGGPIAEKTGEYSVQSFLSAKRDEAGVNGEKLHKAVLSEFKLTPQERSWVATAPVDQTKEYLNRKYSEAAGQVLLKSSSRAKPKDIGGGNGRASSQSSVTSFPGVDARETRRIEKLAEAYWPDPKERALKIKSLRESMETGT